MVETLGPLPTPGDVVRVTWGQAKVPGRVLESYAGVRPRVVVEIDPQEVGEEAVTVTVPLASVQPLGEPASPWAVAAQYEKAVAEALSRVLRDQARNIEIEPDSSDLGVDFAITFKDGKSLLVEAKSVTPKATRFRQLVKQISDLTRDRHAPGLLVMPAPILPEWFRILHATNVQAVTWRDENDDQELARAIQGLIEESSESHLGSPSAEAK
jgi:hypothetical protein